MHSSLTTSATLAIVLAAIGLVSAQRQTEAQEAGISDRNAECQYYDYPPVSSVAKSFPPGGTVATILPNDSEARDKYNAIVSSIPTNIQPRGTNNGDESNAHYDPSDPACWWTYSKCTTPKAQGIPADIIDMPEPSSFGIGFDDGPDCGHNVFYDFLSGKNQKATMFYIGTNVQAYPLEAARAVADGHEVCVHTWSHQYSTSLTNEQMFAELWYTMKIIKAATGVTPTCWRPPYGDIDDRVRAIAHGLNLKSILWTYDSADWSGPGAPNGVSKDVIDKNYQQLVTDAQNGKFNSRGTIMLTHELRNFTEQEMIDWYPTLQKAFKYIVPVGVGYNVTQPYVETNYSLPTFEQYISGTTQVNGSTAATSSTSATGSSSMTKTSSAMAGSSTSPAANNNNNSADAAKSSAGPAFLVPGTTLAALAGVVGSIMML